MIFNIHVENVIKYVLICAFTAWKLAEGEFFVVHIIFKTNKKLLQTTPCIYFGKFLDTTLRDPPHPPPPLKSVRN